MKKETGTTPRRARLVAWHPGFKRESPASSAPRLIRMNAPPTSFPEQPVDARRRRGPFDIVGDVHGCLDELLDLLARLGYVVNGDLHVTPPPGRTLVFLGDLVDRGPSSAGVLRLVMNAVRARSALCVIGNHDEKLRLKLRGRNVQVRPELQQTLAELEFAGADFAREVRRFLDSLPPHLRLDEGKLVVAHAGLREGLHGEHGSKARAFALYGDTTGKRVARAPRLGGEIPWARPRRLRTHAGFSASLAQRDRQHRHGLRVRRPPQRPALPGDGRRERARVARVRQA